MVVPFEKLPLAPHDASEMLLLKLAPPALQSSRPVRIRLALQSQDQEVMLQQPLQTAGQSLSVIQLKQIVNTLLQ